MKEQWKDLIEYPTKEKKYFFENGLYEISNFGKIRNKKTKQEFVMTEDHLLKNKNFHKRTRLTAIDKTRPHVILARAVAFSFIKTKIDIIENGLEVDHIDGDPGNDIITNLQWVMPEENKRFNKKDCEHKTVVEQEIIKET